MAQGSARHSRSIAGYVYGGTIYFSSSGTFTKGAYPGLSAVEVTCIGAGGGGGGADQTSNTSAGGGGGGGATAISFILASDLPSSVSVSVGSGGSAGAATPAASGGTGGDTTWGSTVVVAKGGSGGVCRQGAGGFPADPGSGGSASSSTGDLTINGNPGLVGWFDNGAIEAFGGNGGTTTHGAGGKGTDTSSSGSGANGEDGFSYGGGGGGAAAPTTTSNRTGGAGADGGVIVDLYYSSVSTLSIVQRPDWETEIAKDSPVGWLKLNEPSGSTATDSGSAGSNGSYVSVVNYQQTPPAGVGGYSIDLDGSADYITWNAIASSVTGSTYSFECWFAPDVVGSQQAIISAHDSTGATNRWIVFLDFGSTTSGRISIWDGSTDQPSSVYVDGGWHHVAVTADGNSIKLYLDGAQVVASETVATLTGTDLISLGQEYDSGPTASDFFNGKVAQWVAYDKSLSAHRIMAHYLAGVQG